MARSSAATTEYHTSLDNLALITQNGLEGAFVMLRKCIQILEANRVYGATMPCEPQLGKRGLYPTISTRGSGAEVRTMMNLLAYADGREDLLAIADRIETDALECSALADKLAASNLLKAD